MKELAARNSPIVRTEVSKQEAMDFFTKKEMNTRPSFSELETGQSLLCTVRAASPISAMPHLPDTSSP
jgi:hypothetical protein